MRVEGKENEQVQALLELIGNKKRMGRFYKPAGLRGKAMKASQALRPVKVEGNDNKDLLCSQPVNDFLISCAKYIHHVWPPEYFVEKPTLEEFRTQVLSQFLGREKSCKDCEEESNARNEKESNAESEGGLTRKARRSLTRRAKRSLTQRIKRSLWSSA